MTTFYEILEQKNYPSEVKSYLEELFKEVFCVLEPEFLEIETYFQPVFSLSPRKVIGYEAFSRPKTKTEILKLLEKAKTKGRLFEFDLYCRFIAVLSAWERGYKGESFLFLNIHPGILDKKILLQDIFTNCLSYLKFQQTKSFWKLPNTNVLKITISISKLFFASSLRDIYWLLMILVQDV